MVLFLFFPKLSCLLLYCVTIKIKKYLAVLSVREPGEENKVSVQLKASQIHFYWKKVGESTMVSAESSDKDPFLDTEAWTSCTVQ